MSSGATVSDEALSEFQKLKNKSAYKYVLFHIAENLEIKVEKTSSSSASYEDFLHDLKSLPTDACRYAVFDFEWNHTEDKKAMKKIIFVVWCPDTAAVKNKMLYASSKDKLKKSLDYVVEIQATDFSEVSVDTVIQKLERK